MSRAICVPFHRYHPHVSDLYRIYFNRFKTTIGSWEDIVDRLYFIDSDYGFDPVADELPIEAIVIQKSRNGSHWDNLRLAAKEIKEDYVLFLDQDFIIWDDTVLEDWFDKAQNFDVLTSFDGSGGFINRIQSRFPIMKTYEAARMGTYNFILNRKALALMIHSELAPIYFNKRVGAYIRELGVQAKKNDWLDSFGHFTLKLLYNNFDFGHIYDNRASIYLEDDGMIRKEDQVIIPGYYHIRNGNLPILMLDQNREEYQDQLDHLLEITPKREITRMLAWLVYIGLSEDKLIEALSLLSIDKGLWDTYYKEFIDFHSLPC